MAPYQYEESGLADVFLDGGVALHDTAYGRGVAIEDTAGLHRAIGLWLIERQRPLNGTELRFIRREMELTQHELADLIGTLEQTLRFWETRKNKRGQTIPPTADRLVRALFAEHLGEQPQVRGLLERLVQPAATDYASTCFRRVGDRWLQEDVPDRRIDEVDVETVARRQPA